MSYACSQNLKKKGSVLVKLEFDGKEKCCMQVFNGEGKLIKQSR